MCVLVVAGVRPKGVRVWESPGHEAKDFMVSVIKRNMETALKDLRRWIRRHYPEAPNAPLMRRILEEYAQPIAEAVESVETSSEWMRHDVHELLQSLRLPWVEVIDPPPRTLTAEEFEVRVRQAARRTRAIWKEQMDRWASELADDGDPFKVEEEDVKTLRLMAEAFSGLKVLKSPEHVRVKMDAVIEAAVARRGRRERRKQERVAKRQAEVRAEAEAAKRELEARKATARAQGLAIGKGKRAHPPVEHGMLARRRKEGGRERIVTSCEL